MSRANIIEKLYAFVAFIMNYLYRRFSEWIPLVIAFFMWYLSPSIIHKYYPKAAEDDGGLIQAVIFSGVQYLVAVTLSWIALRSVFPKIGRYVDGPFGNDLQYMHNSDNLVNRKFAMIMTVVVFGIYFLGAIWIFSTCLKL